MKISIFIIFLFLISVFFYLDSGCTFNCIEKIKFGKKQWHENVTNKSGYSSRLNMTPDLVCNKLKKDMSKKEIINLLGEPQSKRWSDVYPYYGWPSGRYPESVSNSTGLFIEFNTENKLIEVFSPYWWGTSSFSIFGKLKCLNI